MKIYRKHVKLSFVMIFMFANLCGQMKVADSFFLFGHVNFNTDRNIYFVWYNANEDRFVDSTKVTNGSFTFKGICNGYCDRFYIKSDYTNKRVNDTSNSVQVPIDNSVMYIRLKVGEFSKYILSGCRACDLLKRTDSSFSAYYNNIDIYHVT